MNGKYLKVKIILVLSGVEIGFLFIANDIELFFMVWSVIWLIFLASSISSNLNIFRAIGTMSDDANYANMAGARAEIECIPEKIRRKRQYQSINILYAILLIINVIAYIIVVAKKY